VDLRAVEIFLAVCETGSLSAAAREMGISQAAVSQRLAQLEKDIGTALLDRHARPMRLLPAGAQLKERGRSLLAEVDNMLHTLRRFGTAEIPELRIGILESLGGALVPKLVPELRRIVGSLSVISGSTGPLVPEIARGDLDIAITSERLDEIHDLECHTLITEPFVLVLPKSCAAPTDIADLPRLEKKLTFVRHSRRRRMRGIIDRYLERYSVELPNTVEFASTAPIVDLVQQGIGWAILTPLALLSARAEVGALTVTPLPGARLSRQIELVAPRERLADIPLRVAEQSKRILANETLPAMIAYAPFAIEHITIGDLP
jgi:DNA-binding transcriptional LysR family regulator